MAGAGTTGVGAAASAGTIGVGAVASAGTIGAVVMAGIIIFTTIEILPTPMEEEAITGPIL